MLALSLSLGGLTAFTLTGCKGLPSSDVDDLSRTLRKLDAAQRPNGEDLPIERFVAWTASRDSGRVPNDQLDVTLRALIDEQFALLARLRDVPGPTQEAREIVAAYVKSHTAMHEGMEETLAGRRLGDAMRAHSGEAQATGGLDAIRAARTLRKARCEMLGVADRGALEEPEAPSGGPIGNAASKR